MDLSELFLTLFEGQTDAHGLFIPDGEVVGNKVKGTIRTVREQPTREKWSQHLTGQKGIGIIPINKDSQCRWAVIDVDDYPIDYSDLLKKVSTYPLVVCKSKSGGAHLFIFLNTFTSARMVRDYLRNTVSVLGLSKCEVFPKQDTLMAERGDVGNWLNMPYYGDTRKCIVLKDEKLVELSASEFLEHVKQKTVDLSLLNKDEIDYNQSELKDAPPCLQILSIKGFPQNTRNKALFNIGVFLKKSDPSTWKGKLKYFNKQFYSGNGNEPLSERELETLTKSLDKKEYFYQCYEEPMCSFCNAKLCRTRKFGISNATSIPIINSVTKIAGDVSLWFIEVEGGRLELTTQELYDNRTFTMKCMNSLNIIPMRMNMEKWHAFLQNVLDQSIVIYDEHMFAKHEIPILFRQFIKSRLSKDVAEVAHGRVLYRKDDKEVWFKQEAFLQYVKSKRIDTAKSAIIMWFRERGMRNSVAKDANRKSIRYLAVRLDDAEKEEIETTIKEQEEVI